MSLATCAARYFFNLPGVYGKRHNGTLRPLMVCLHGPWLALTWVAWTTTRWLSNEAPFHQLLPDIWIGCRLTNREVPDDFENLIDLTAEFSEPSRLRQRPGYRLLPILNAGVPNVEQLVSTLDGLKSLSTKTYIHCAQGHGRTAVFAAAWQMYRGLANSADSALELVRAVRPQASINRAQAIFLQEFGRRLPNARYVADVDAPRKQGQVDLLNHKNH
jgi:protein-tyrosine phosphatase